MISGLFRRTRADASIASLYGTIVAQARATAFYQAYGVPDTAAGRLEMIMLHTVLFLLRVEGEAPPLRALGQGLFDHFCADMDANVREMGVGDLAVPRRMRRIGEAFYGRQAAYRSALARCDAVPLQAALARNVYGNDAPPGCVARLAAYVREAQGLLAAQSAEGLMRAAIAWPKPAPMSTDA
jgi:cytochrome b pre-mRNA-processing protein 3